MQAYLEQFYKSLAGWKGSLIKVEHVQEANAKEYLSKLAKAGLVEKVRWGWYWIPDKAQARDFWEFLRKDRSFKIIAGQTAASFWNHDFIHREVYIVKVKDPSYGSALQAFAESRGWNVVVEPFEEDRKYVKVKGISVETLEDCIIECMRRWAFTDAFAALYENRKRELFSSLAKRSYWIRIPKTDVRVRQALGYGCYRLNEAVGDKIFPVRKTDLEDSFVRKEIDEAIEKVVELG
ncbi:MAG: hypothetical protein HY730_02425 [Candidatus Tectomicrobia bacterium]|uniref:AbiEi antitoxin C-terminal domain-containing protein n=1 Tax=Tectimicrobiota bacterium TaxID=2528274 RepID=A0A933LQ14_UNCTE|nr:hypothetical protein [Candidatus Tectomicrobia bacterium]